MDAGSGRRRRRRHSEQFKAEAIAACRKPGMSIAAAAMERSINANLLRRWLIDAERASDRAALIAEPTKASPPEGFVSIPLAPPAIDGPPIHLELRRGPLTVSVKWQKSALECALWLREVLK
jgi:transposase